MTTNTRRMRTQSILGDRQRLTRELNLNFKGGRQRDIYESAGYDKEILYAQYLARYLRQDVARRVVNTPADESWRLPPELLDGPDPDTAQEDTEFTRAWLALANNRGEDGNTRRGLLHYLHRLDRISGIGRYGVLFLGIKDDKKPSDPAESSSDGELLFASVFDEDSAAVATYDNNQQSARYGQPEVYRLVDRTDAGSKTTFEAHWTRCVHVADNPLSSDLVGSPRLEAVWNRLLDLEKVAAATGESGWRLMMPGYVFSTKDGYELGPDADNHTEQLDEFTHELRRWLELNGMEVQELAGTLQDPSGAVNVALKLISAGTGIPLRKLTGSEQGQLASGQDDDNWIDIVEARQAQHVTPAIIEPVVHRLIWLGVLPEPTNGGFSVWWPSLRKKDPKDVATIADTTASALQKVQAKVKPRLFAETYLPDLPSEAVEEERKEPPPMPPAFGAPNNAPVDGKQPPAQDGQQQDQQQDQAQPGAAGEGGLPAVNVGGFRWVVYP